MYFFIKTYIKYHYFNNIKFYNIIFFKNFYNFIKLFFKKNSTYPSYNYVTGLEYKLLSLINFSFLKKNNFYYSQKLKLNKLNLVYFDSIKISTLPIL